ncbi:Exosome complex exonuclease RRP42 [Heterocephalus glaber]|uniref:Ribosomal RNA-processing protein 42 n=1 Tax=Heterocephalus glaber TaxID=10181 RepID=G5ANM9_HETGA|nr:Exosome complex exonuclease RRP42 [Heterocephalus glaber]
MRQPRRPCGAGSRPRAVSLTQEDLRVDGRSCEDYRCAEVETGVVSNTSGSARVQLGHTDILVGVKAEMGTPKLEKPDEGYLEFFVDWEGLASTSVCNPASEASVDNGLAAALGCPYRTGEHSLWQARLRSALRGLPWEGASEQPGRSWLLEAASLPAQELLLASSSSSASATPEFEGRGGDDLGTEIASTLYRIFSSRSSVDLQSLCISPREHCWVLYVDVLLLECGGNLFDAISLAVKAALFNTRIPKVRVLEDEEGSKDIELSDDPYDCMQLSVENVPCIVTLCKIGCRHVVDATLQEEACSLASLLVAVTSSGVVTCMRKVGKGSLDPESIFEMMETGKRVGKVQHTTLQDILHKEESLGPRRQKVGFLG